MASVSMKFDRGFNTSHLTGIARELADAIMARLQEVYKVTDEGEANTVSSGGCSVFNEGGWNGWAPGSFLTICHEGTEVDHHFSMDKAYEMGCLLEDAGFPIKSAYKNYEAMQAILAEHGMYLECINRAVSAVYSAR